METDYHARDPRPRPHRHRGPDRPRLRCARPVLPVAAAGGHRHPGLGQVRSATLPPVACRIRGPSPFSGLPRRTTGTQPSRKDRTMVTNYVDTARADVVAVLD